MQLDALLSTIILVSFLVTIIMAVGSYAAYKLREARRPHAGGQHAASRAAPGESAFFEQVRAEDLAADPRPAAPGRE